MKSDMKEDRRKRLSEEIKHVLLRQFTGMKSDASYTVEGTFIFCWIIFLMISFLKLDFRLHDTAMLDACQILTDLRSIQMENYAYDSTKDSQDVAAILSAKVTSSKIDDTEYTKETKERAKSYYDAHRIGTSTTWDLSEGTKTVNYEKNATILRAGNRIVKLIGEE